MSYRCKNCYYILTNEEYKQVEQDNDSGFLDNVFAFMSGEGTECPICGKSNFEKVKQ